MGGKQKYLVLFGAATIQQSLCLTFYFGNISTYIYSLHFYTKGDSDSFDIDVSWMLPMYLLCRFVGTFIVDRSARVMGLRKTSAWGAVVSISSTFATYYTVSYSIWATALTLTLIGGMGNAVLSIANFVFLAHWFPVNVGLAISLLHCSSAVAGIATNQIITNFVNPDNLSPDASNGELSYFSQPEIIERMPRVFLVMGGMSLFFCFIGVLFLKDPPNCDNTSRNEEESRLLDLKNEEVVVKDRTASFLEKHVELSSSTKKERHENEQNAKLVQLYKSFESSLIKPEIKKQTDDHGNQGISGNDDTIITLPKKIEPTFMTPMQVLKSPKFYFLEFALLSQATGLIIAENYFKLFGQLWIKDDEFLATVGSSMAFAVIFIVPPCGYILEKIGTKNALIGHLAVAAIASFLLYFTAMIDRWLYLVWIVVVFMANFNQFILYPVACLKYFGTEYYAANYGLSQTATLLAYIIGPPVMTWVLSELGWFWMFFVTGSLAFCALIPIVLWMPKDN